jgi:ribokinase
MTILCVGDIDVDTLIAVPRLPELDDKVDGRELTTAPGGMAANVAVGLARLGAPVRLFGSVGDDAVGREAARALAGEGVDVTRVVCRAGAATFRCLVFLAPSGEKALVRLASDAYLPTASDLDATLFTDVSRVHLTLGSPELALATLDLARARNLETSLDLEEADMPPDNATLRHVLARVTLLFVNRRARAALERRLGPDALAGLVAVTTEGAAGSAYAAGATVERAAGFAVEPVDTTGAGDAFCAAFLFASHVRGLMPAAALRFANAAAALSTRAAGAQTALATAAEVDALLAAAAARP